MIIYGASNKGMIRQDNQDSYLFDSIGDNASFAVVCDGMGGPGGGKTASRTAVKTIAKFMTSGDCLDSRELFDNAVSSANDKILAKANKDPKLTGMGTTMVAVIVQDGVAHFASIGDSRAYLIRSDSIRRITHDHSAVQQLVDKGLLTDSQARNHPNRNIITRAIGVDEKAEFDSFDEPVLPDDLIILCSDGITNYLDDLEISFEALKCAGNIEKIPQTLIELANARGGADNSTVVVLKI